VLNPARYKIEIDGKDAEASSGRFVPTLPIYPEGFVVSERDGKEATGSGRLPETEPVSGRIFSPEHGCCELRMSTSERLDG